MYYSKKKPTFIHYRKLKDFNNEAFVKDLKALFFSIEIITHTLMTIKLNKIHLKILSIYLNHKC